MKIQVFVTDGQGNSLTESVDISDQREWFNECKTNGANPDLENVSFEQFHSQMMPVNARNLDIFKGKHFIFGWWESFEQRGNHPSWVWKAQNLYVGVNVYR